MSERFGTWLNDTVFLGRRTVDAATKHLAGGGSGPLAGRATLDGMRPLPYLAACLLALTACESDEHKLRRLKTDEAIAALDALGARRDYDSATRVGAPDSVISKLRESMLQAQDRHDLARRALERFLR
jgi:hypothetical protein